MDQIRSALMTIEGWLGWLPAPLVALLIIALAGAIALVRFRVSTLWIVAAGAIVGLAAS